MRALALAVVLVLGATCADAAQSYQVNNGANQTITEHAVCKKVTNNHASGQPIFVPTNTSTEWASFYNGPPPGVIVAACPAIGPAYCWGYNNSGQLGNGNTSQQSSPALVSGGFSDWQVVDSGGWFTCGIRSTGNLYCWGEALNGKLGNGTTTPNRNTPQLIGAATDWAMVSAGFEHTCGIRGGVAYCWGDGPSGQIGNGGTSDQSSPTLVSGGFTDWTAISAGEAISCGIRGSGIAYCWGSAAEGKLGNNTTTPNMNTPQLVNGGYTDWVSIRAGRLTVCGVRSNGLGYCWGQGTASQIGDGAASNRSVPTLVSGSFTDWLKIESYFNHACGVRGNGTMYCWGTGANGQLGLGNGTTFNTPQLVTGGFTNWSDVATGGYYSCGVHGGLSKCWGLNSNAWLGDGTTGQKTTPTLVLGGFTDWEAISTAGSHTCGVR